MRRELKMNTDCNLIKIADTLQGAIYRGICTENGSKEPQKTVVIKVTNQHQHENYIAVINNKQYSTQENIVSEQTILKYLSQQSDFPPVIVKFIAFHQKFCQLYLVMEDGGGSLFHFVQKSHQLLKNKRMNHAHWIQVVKVIFKQIIESLRFIHSKNVCHNDISLENLLINSESVRIRATSDSMQIHSDDIQIKLCDFGLSEHHENERCLSNKYCGKKSYKSPEVTSKREWFDGKKNDIWCAGVCLFMLLFGCIPWKYTSNEDVVFNYIMKGNMVHLLKKWNLNACIEEHSIDLLQSIFQYEPQRISVESVTKHPFLL